MDIQTLEKKLSQIYGVEVTVKGPYACKDGRKRIDVGPKGGKLKTVQLARPLLEIKLGRRLSEDETVDHSDEDKSNDSIENLQPLSLAENARKSAKKSRNLINWQKARIGSPELSEPTQGERNSQSKLDDFSVKQLREGFFEIEGLDQLVEALPMNRKSVRNCLEGKTYPNAGGPLIKFKKGSHESFEVAFLPEENS